MSEVYHQDQRLAGLRLESSRIVSLLKVAIIETGENILPILSMFYGIIIRMYYSDNKQHYIPHIHAEYGNSKAVFSIEDGKLLAGKFPKSKTRLVLA